MAVSFFWEDYGGFPQDLFAVSAASRTSRSRVIEKEAGAGEAGLGFLEFGDVQWRDMEAARFDAGARVRK